MNLALSFRCPQCGYTNQTALQNAGRWVHCPQCLAPFQLPLAPPPSQQASGDLLRTVQAPEYSGTWKPPAMPSQTMNQYSLNESGVYATVAAPSSASSQRPIVQAPSDPLQLARSSLEEALQGATLFNPNAEIHLSSREELEAEGFITVYRAFDRRLNRHAALRILRKEIKDATIRKRFLREAEITARLCHPHIPPIYEFGTTTDGIPFVVTKLLKGKSLKKLLQEEDRPPKELLRILSRVGSAIAFSHDRGIVHRDLEPRNIWVNDYGDVTVTGWEWAKVVSDFTSYSFSAKEWVVFEEQQSAPEQEILVGSLGYIPPEQACGGNVEESADVFALGALLTKILTGEPPIVGETRRDLLEATLASSIATPCKRDPSIDKDLDSLAAAALVASAEKRYLTAAQFTRQLEAYLSKDVVESHQYSLFETMSRKIADKAQLALVALISLSLLFLLSVLAHLLR